MRILVLVKHVPEPTATWRFSSDLTLDRAGVDGRLSQLDEHAAEQALRLAEGGHATGVTFLTMGPAAAAESLRKALAMGGDGAVHVLDEALHGSDALATSTVLAKAIERTGFDLVICGMASTDAEMSVIPSMVAERLGVPSGALRTSTRARRRGPVSPATSATACLATKRRKRYSLRRLAKRIRSARSSSNGASQSRPPGSESSPRISHLMRIGRRSSLVKLDEEQPVTRLVGHVAEAARVKADAFGELAAAGAGQRGCAVMSG